MRTNKPLRSWPFALLMLCFANLVFAASTLTVNQQLTSNQYLASDNGKFRLYMQGDGNLVLRDWTTRNALWSSKTNGKGGVRVKLQPDGNLVMSRSCSGCSVWDTKTSGSGASRLVMQNDGNLVMYTSANKAVWATGTVSDPGNGTGGGTGGNNSEMVGVLNQIRGLSGTIILDWDNTIDIDSDYTVGATAPQWMNAFAEANIDAWLVTGNGNTSRIESAVLGAVSSSSANYWRNLLRNKAYYGEATGQKEDKYERIMGSRDKATFMLADDASANQDDFRVVTNGKGYQYRPRNGYANYAEFLTNLKGFLSQLQNNNGGNTGGGSGSIEHIGTTQVWDSNGQGVTVSRPSGVRSGDLLVLVLHRTDDHLPFAVPGWNRAAECYKEDNGYQCLNVSDCTTRDGNFCDRFQGKYRGRDLAQVVFWKRAGSSEPSSYSFDMNKDSDGHPGWAILTALRGANTSDPIRDTADRGCDRYADSLFPSVYGKKGDMLLLSMSFDDAVSQRKFGAPSGMSTFGYVSNSDEAGFLYGGILDKDGQTGERKTRGDGASSCKDALVSVTIKAQ